MKFARERKQKNEFNAQRKLRWEAWEFDEEAEKEEEAVSISTRIFMEEVCVTFMKYRFLLCPQLNP